MNDKRFEEGLEEQSEKALMESESGIEAQKAETQAAAEEEEKPEKNGPGQEAEIAEPPGKKHKIFKIVLLVIILTAVAVGIGVYVGYANYYSGRFFEGTVINQIDCSGLTVEQVEDILAEQVEDYSIELTFRGDARQSDTNMYLTAVSRRLRTGRNPGNGSKVTLLRAMSRPRYRRGMMKKSCSSSYTACRSCRRGI